VPALRALAERKGREGSFEIDILARLGGTDGARLPAELESTVYRLVQEALNNAVKHAGAHRVEAMLELRGDVIELAVRDDGRGFDPSVVSGGYGLTGMRERVGLAGGTIRVEATPGEGTSVLATIPVRRSAERGQRSSSPRSRT